MMEASAARGALAHFVNVLCQLKHLPTVLAYMGYPLLYGYLYGCPYSHILVKGYIRNPRKIILVVVLATITLSTVMLSGVRGDDRHPCRNWKGMDMQS